MRKANEMAAKFMNDEDGLGTVEVVLITVVLVGLVALFKKEIGTVVKSVLGTISTNSTAITAAE